MRVPAVVFSVEAEDQLVALRAHIAGQGAPVAARRYVAAIVRHCMSLRNFPLRGVPRDDLRPGLRLTRYRGRTVIAYAVEDEAVRILGVYYGGQNLEFLLQDDDGDSENMQ